MKAVSVYLKQKLKEQFVMFSLEIMPCACCWKSQPFLREIATLKWSRGRTDVVQGERHQWRLAIRTEDSRHVSKLCVKTLFFSENFHS